MFLKTVLGILFFFFLTIAYFLYVDPGTFFNWSVDMQRAKAGLVKKMVKIDGHDVAYLETKNYRPDKKTIVFVHGFSGHKDHWTQIASYLYKDYNLLLIDLPGFGESTRKDPQLYTIPQQVDRLHQVVSMLNLEKFHLAGSSMGGHISSLYTITYPDKVDTLALYTSAGVTSPEPSEHALSIARGKNMLLPNTSAEFKETLNFVFEKPPYMPGNIVDHLAELSIKDRAFNGAAYLAMYRDSPHPLDSSLEKIQVNTFILWCDNDNVIDVSAARIFNEKLAKSKLVIMENCGHLPMMERPEESASHYIKFLDSI